MINVALPDELVRKLEAIARQENRAVPEVLSDMVEEYQPKSVSQEEADEAFDALFGIHDDDVTDMSTTVRETLKAYYEKKGRPD